MPHFGTMELLIILTLVLLLFGARKVPEMARGLGQGLKEFKRGLREAAAEATDLVPDSETAASHLMSGGAPAATLSEQR